MLNQIPLLSNLILELAAKNQFVIEYSPATTFITLGLTFSFFLYFSGILGIIYNHKNFFITMLAIELMYLGAITSFVLYGSLFQDARGLIYALIILILAACESAVGLGILIVLHRFVHSIDFAAYQELGG